MSKKIIEIYDEAIPYNNAVTLIPINYNGLVSIKIYNGTDENMDMQYYGANNNIIINETIATTIQKQYLFYGFSGDSVKIINSKTTSNGYMRVIILIEVEG